MVFLYFKLRTLDFIKIHLPHRANHRRIADVELELYLMLSVSVSHNIDYLLNALRQLIFGPGNSNLDGNHFTHDTVRLGQIYIFVVRTVCKKLLRYLCKRLQLF